MPHYRLNDSEARFCPDCSHYLNETCLLWRTSFSKKPSPTANCRADQGRCGDGGKYWERIPEYGVIVVPIGDTNLSAVGVREDD